MLESISIVSGLSPGPAPLAHALFSSSEATLSKLRASPKEKLRKNVPSVEGAGTQVPRSSSARPERSTSASSIELPPTSAEATRAVAFWPTLACPGASPRCTPSSSSSLSPSRSANVIGSTSPALATALRSSKTTSKAPNLRDDCRI